MDGTETKSIEMHLLTPFLKERLTEQGAKIDDLPLTPFADRVANEAQAGSGWQCGFMVKKEGFVGRLGVWLVPLNAKLDDLQPVLRHYREQLEPRGFGVHILNIATELGQVFIFWDSEKPLAAGQNETWIAQAEHLTDAVFGEPAFSQFLQVYRRPPEEAAAAAQNGGAGGQGAGNAP